MANFTSSPSPSIAAACSLFEKPIALTTASSSSLPPPSSFGGALDDGVEDGCCICLEPFTVHDPTSLKDTCLMDIDARTLLPVADMNIIFNAFLNGNSECDMLFDNGSESFRMYFCTESFNTVLLNQSVLNHSKVTKKQRVSNMLAVICPKGPCQSDANRQKPSANQRVWLYIMHLCSQQLLDAVRIERNYRSRNTSVMPTDLHHFHDSFGVEEDAFHSDDSDFDEHILQHLAFAASRVRYVRRRERQRSSGLGPSQVFFSTSPENMPGTLHLYPNSPDESQTLSHGLPQCDSRASGIPLVITSPRSPVTPSVNRVSSAASSGDEAIKLSQPPVGTPSRPSSAESVSFSESIKSKWSNASARYKESISKGTRGLKEKLLARNNSVKEVSKGVQREMSAGVAKMIERLDISSKRPGASKPASGGTGCTLNFLFKGKDVEENVIAQSLANNHVEFARGLKSEAPSHLSSITPDKLEASLHQVSRTFF
ncbi:P-loop containing nucleoside triphosphate hydrolases superfamily protein isoform 1 [Hibiscus syriacus]|uniref:P-loop containing nucleoside triphosphate hydrolases superfamily protein isoform 1 n=1 Tax=Hibiscus syriacus TaxID=106335 RepID=A0A6A3CLM9_HIBSY|nr:P-loop containing nucleoside triphosphate hydrolases superfamily protein isoform 1 [Hibiscus syriacus]